MRLNILFVVLFYFLSIGSIVAQPLNAKETFTRADTLRGMLTPLRTCYDINYYHLQVKVTIDQQYIRGSNLFKFTATQDFKELQFDLFAQLNIEKIVYQNQELPYRRQFNAVFVTFPEIIKKDSQKEFTVFYSGYPTIAKNAPWDGGFVFSKDKAGKPWVGVACQGLGASSWWPNKDHLSDEVDSMQISVTTPDTLMDVSNGRLRSVEQISYGEKTYHWFVSYPINNYNVTLNIGDYMHFSDQYQGVNGSLSLDYYVLKENLSKAQKHFAKEVRPMLQAFEYWLGPYPFYRDGYKLVETPYLGMEHQSVIAYGNQYKGGYFGKDLSGTGKGLLWDFIIVHESGHEWFGNYITAKDIADMWIHEAFTMYAEGLYTEYTQSKEEGQQYIAGLRKHIKNDRPIIGYYHVNKEGSGDMYYKGANMLQTIRTIINNDIKWREILRGLNTRLGLKTTTTEEVVAYINKKAGKNLSKVFDQYLRYSTIPTLEVKKTGKNVYQYRWAADVKNFDMPVKVNLPDQKVWMFIYPTQKWKEIKTNQLEVDTIGLYIEVKQL